MRVVRGVTLIELMSVLALVALLALVVVPSYRAHVLRAHRSEGIAGLLRIRAAQEKFFLQNNAYTTDFGPGGLRLQAQSDGPLLSENKFYRFEISVPDPAAGAGSPSFRAVATAQGGQADDTSCTTLAINDRGLRSAGPEGTERCWR